MAEKRRLDPTSLVARIIAELQANPDAQRLLLRALLTNEFLGMPARLDRIEKDIAELKADVAHLKTDVAQLKTDVAHLKTDVSHLKADVAYLKADVSYLKGDVAYLKGSDLEHRLHRKIRPLVSGAFTLRRASIVHSPVQETDRAFRDRVEDALDGGRITDEHDARIEATDFILRAQRRADRAPVWVAVEASYKVHANDIQRARATADALGAALDEEAIAAVAGYRIDPPAAQRAEASGVRYLRVPLPTPEAA